jgi:flotillin
MQLAPVEAQIVLAKEIGENHSYQQYLITIEQIKANQVVGFEQAKALQTAQIKVISNAGKPTEGISGVMDMFSSNGGQSVAAMLEGLTQTEIGKKLVDKFVTPKA